MVENWVQQKEPISETDPSMAQQGQLYLLSLIPFALLTLLSDECLNVIRCSDSDSLGISLWVLALVIHDICFYDPVKGHVSQVPVMVELRL